MVKTGKLCKLSAPQFPPLKLMLFQHLGRVRQEDQGLHETLSQNKCGQDAAHTVRLAERWPSMHESLGWHTDWAWCWYMPAVPGLGS